VSDVNSVSIFKTVLKLIAYCKWSCI